MVAVILMRGELRFPDGFSLESFVDVFIKESIEFVGRKEKIPLIDFDKDLRKIIKEKTGVDESVILYLHHSFYWEFFLGNNPILNRFQTSENGKISYVELPEDYSEREVDFLVKSFLEKYAVEKKDNKKSYLVSRIQKINSPKSY